MSGWIDSTLDEPDRTVREPNANWRRSRSCAANCRRRATNHQSRILKGQEFDHG
jgi:hypothetical protein